MNISQTEYYKRVIKHNLEILNEQIKNSKNEMELKFYKNRKHVQMRDFARALNCKINMN